MFYERLKNKKVDKTFPQNTKGKTKGRVELEGMWANSQKKEETLFLLLHTT